MTPERSHWRRSDIFIVNFDHNSHLFVLLLLLTLNMKMFVGSNPKKIINFNVFKFSNSLVVHKSREKLKSYLTEGFVQIPN